MSPESDRTMAPLDGSAPLHAKAPGNVRFIVLVGLMGAGKTSLGKRLSKFYDLPFIDSDAEIEKAAGCSIAEIFARFGEAYFRDGERRVIERILTSEPCVMATGGGSFMDDRVRALVKEHALSIWLRADLETLVKRTSKRRDERPLLKAGDPREILGNLIEQRYPVYAEADIVVDVGDEPPEKTSERVHKIILAHTAAGAPRPSNAAI
jgi:shikimate kinase